MCYWLLRKRGTTVYQCDESCGRGTAWARQRKMRYMCSRKEQKRAFLLSPLIERLQIKVRENTKIFAVVKCAWGVTPGLHCIAMSKINKSTHTAGERLSLRSSKSILDLLWGQRLKLLKEMVSGPFQAHCKSIVRVLNCCYHYSD